MQRTGRSPLFSRLRRAFGAARRENHRRAGTTHRGLTRRRLLTGTAAGLIAAYTRPARAANRKARIAVVGAGIAGLNATYLLATGRIQRGALRGIGPHRRSHPDELRVPWPRTSTPSSAASSSTATMTTCSPWPRCLDFGLIDTEAPSEDGLQVAYFAAGPAAERRRSHRRVPAPGRDRRQRLVADSATRSPSTATRRSTPSSIDTNLRDYLRRNLTVDWLYDILEAAYVNEFGLNLEDQSSLNFVLTIGTDTSSGFQIYGSSDQRYKIRGGNHQIVAALADAVSDRIALGYRLEALDRQRNGRVRAHLRTGRTADNRKVVADFVVLCLPFTILRDIDVRVPLPPIKRKAIQQLGYGVDAKLILGFQSRVWRALGFDGDSYADQPYQSGWDSSREQPSPFGAYTIYPGGSQALDLRTGSAHQQAERLLPGLNRVFPGVRQQWLGTALRAYWPSNPFVRASYAAYRARAVDGHPGRRGPHGREPVLRGRTHEPRLARIHERRCRIGPPGCRSLDRSIDMTRLEPVSRNCPP